jgi:hypothetical protein
MSLPASHLHPGTPIRLVCAGQELSGTVITSGNGWLRLAEGDGECLVNLAQVAWIRARGRPAPAPLRSDGLPVPEAKEIVSKPGGGKVPGRPWSDETVRAVVEEFLNDRPDGEIAEVHGRTRHQVTVLRQAWECARGNLPEDRISPAARLWVERVRGVMRA